MNEYFMVVARALWFRRYPEVVLFAVIPSAINGKTIHIIPVRRTPWLWRNETSRLLRVHHERHQSFHSNAWYNTSADSTKSASISTDNEIQQQHPQRQLSFPTNLQLLFFSLVPVEPTFSAAGVRSLHLLNQFLRQNDTIRTDQDVDPATAAGITNTSVHIISPPTTISTPPVALSRLPEQMSASIVERDTPGFQYHTLTPNRTDDAYKLLDEICGKSSFSITPHPENTFYIIIYDRYYSEEMYSFQVYNYFHDTTTGSTKNNSSRRPNRSGKCMFLLDMQDMHSLRYTRQLWVKHQNDMEQNKQCSATTCSNDAANCIIAADEDVLRNTIPSDTVVPSLADDQNSDKLLRELASIYRCDLTLVCSMYEYNLLVHYYHIPATKLCIAPLFGRTTTSTGTAVKTYSPVPPQQASPVFATKFHARQDFVFVGGMKHEPNVDAIRQLKRLWPQIRQKFINDGDNNSNDHENIKHDCVDSKPEQIPNLYIYGAQCSDHFRNEIHNPSNGIYMEGYYPYSISNVLYNKRVLLSPLRFGAGIKGKHIEAWNCSLPIVTTSIGSEGMLYPNKFNSPNFLTSPASTSSPTIIPFTDSERPIFGGSIVNSDAEFIHAAYTLYTNQDHWDLAVQSIRPELLYDLCEDWDRIHSRIVDVIRCKINHERCPHPQVLPKSLTAADVIQGILRHQTNRSTEYFSRYIELKEGSNKQRTP